MKETTTHLNKTWLNLKAAPVVWIHKRSTLYQRFLVYQPKKYLDQSKRRRKRKRKIRINRPRRLMPLTSTRIQKSTQTILKRNLNVKSK